MGAYDPEKEIRQPLLRSNPSTTKSSPGIRRKSTVSTVAFSLVLLGAVLALLSSLALLQIISDLVEKSPAQELEACAWNTLKHHVSLLDVPQIGQEEFLKRQSILAAALDKAGVDAFVAEPSASSSYYANISSAYDLSERPFLMILDRTGKFSYLAPKFELGRIAGLDMVFNEKTVIEWAEEESPYEVLKRETGYKKVMLDEHVRFMIAAGVQATGIDVVPMSEAIQSLRAVKTEAELAILRAINEFTLELIRSLQKCIEIGMAQETINTAAFNLFSRAGVGKGFWAIVLFGEQAASPHGGSSGKILQDGEFVLLDTGSKLHDYGSDVTRTILPSKSRVSKELMGIWNIVHASQGAAVELMRLNETCSDVDAASRKVIIDAGYGEFFTHRLGHGLGLEMHEHPYLNGANSEELKIGEVVTNEPGIYVTGEQAKALGKSVGFGVRLEDPVLVTADGGVTMTGSRAKSPYEP
ncbi:peptidase M24, structural domain-containing protein [Rhexocercosporidium sp. MPI-PUGE-AT-0058]|nr:peptidase M24, structural domain-containing protein [Rhexocercosporidium sp. MPI-PUGE-AT-0058]